VEPRTGGVRETPEIALCVGLDRLISVRIFINGMFYSAIVDTGATCSYLPQFGAVLRREKPKLYDVNVRSKLAVGTHVEHSSDETKLMVSLDMKDKPVEAVFLVVKGQTNILDHEILLGLPEIHKLGLSVVPREGQLCVMKDNAVIGMECVAASPTQALLSVRHEKESTNELKMLLNCFRDCFAEKAHSTIKCKPVRVFFTKKTPFKAKPARFSPDNMAQLKKILDRWLKDGIIERTNSPYCCSSHFVPKKSGELRLVNNYIPINQRVVWDNYPLPVMADMMPALEGARYFSALDLTEGFLQVPLDRQDRHKLAFVTPLGMYQFTRLPYGYINSPSAFQRAMNEIFWMGLYKRCIVYIDDILVYGRTEAEHHENLEWVLRKCQEFNVKLNPKKCKLFQTQVQFLGFEISEGTIAPCRNKFEDVFAKPPDSKEELVTILGKLGFYARFIENFSELTYPLRCLARKNEKFQWTEHHDECLRKLKASLDSALPQILPSPDSKKIAEIMIRKFSIEVILMTEDNKLIGRASQILSPTESRYTAVEKALLAMILAYRHFVHFMTTTNVTFKTGVKSLKRTLELVDMPPRIERLILRLPPHVNPEIVFEEKLVFNQTLQEQTEDRTCAKKVKFAPDVRDKEEESNFEAVYYTDGACKGNGKPDGRASWAFVETKPLEYWESGLVSNEPPTNQVAELRAATNAIKRARAEGKRSILIYTDSEYTAEAINGRVESWKSNGWLACNNKTVVNKQALQELGEAIGDLKVVAVKLPGHAGIPGNERADALAKQELVALISPQDEEQDEEIKEILELMETDESVRSKYKYEKGRLYRLVHTDKDRPLAKLFVPKRQRSILMYFAHDNDLFGGHMGVKKTLGKLQSFYWPKMTQQVTKYVKTCDVCQRFKEDKGLKQGFMHILPVQKAFETVFMDLITPIHRSFSGNGTIITLIDGYTRYGIAKAFNQVLSETVVDFVTEEVLLRHGLVKRIICDNGSVFKSSVFQNAMQKLGIEVSFTCPYNPQANGRVERWNGTLKGILKKYIDKDQFDWDKHLSKAVYIYNNTRHESTNYSPYELLHGRANRSPLRVSDSREYQFEDFDPDRILARELANENINKSALVSKYYYDKKHRAAEFEPGQEILVRVNAIPLRLSRKLVHKWTGPFRLIKLIGNRDDPKVVIFSDQTDKVHRASFANIKPYHRRDETESRELERIIETYEKEGYPALVRDVDSNKTESITVDSEEETDKTLRNTSVVSPEDENPELSSDLDNLYEPRPIPTQELLVGRPRYRFGPQPVKRLPCRPTILRRPEPREPVVVPLISPIEVLDTLSKSLTDTSEKTPQGIGVPADYDPLSILESSVAQLQSSRDSSISDLQVSSQVDESAIQNPDEPVNENDELAMALENLFMETQRLGDDAMQDPPEQQIVRRSTRIPMMKNRSYRSHHLD